MGRAREFDEEAVLDRAGAVFWRHGYAVVSIQDLEAATGLGRGSLYNAFGDKEGLFIAVLDRYVAQYGEASFRHLQNDDVAAGIERMLDAVIARMSNPRNPRGCLLANATLAFGTGSPRIDAHVAGKIAAMQDLLEVAIARARDDGQIDAGADPRQLAHFYGAVVQSLGVMHRAAADEKMLRDIVAVAMRSWPGRSARAAGARRSRARATRRNV